MRQLTTLVLVATAALAACGGKSKKPTLQTVTTPTPADHSRDHAEAPPSTAVITPSGPDADRAPPSGPIYFEFDSTTLSSESRDVLTTFGAWMESHKVEVTIEGHADERGTTEYNLALGQKRAEVIADYLARLGVAPARLHTISYGEERPAVEGEDETAFARNRRGELRPGS